VRIFNYSRIDCDRALWHSLARDLGLDGVLRDADLVDRKDLTVVIHRDRRRRDAGAFDYGSSTLGRIDVFPCRACAPGALLLTFLHELAHCWLHEVHEEDFFQRWAERLSERFALRAYAALGGRASDECHLQTISPPRRGRMSARELIEGMHAREQGRTRGSGR
jgi:hypothetical protein